MQYKQEEIKEGIKLHLIQSEKFKTNLIAIFLTTKLQRETVTKNALISTILRRGTKNMPTQEDISMQMEEMYGASFDCGIDKTGDNQVIKFYIETVNDTFLPQEAENMLKTSLEKLLEIAFNPYTENDAFKTEYLEQEKNNIKQRIEGKKDNKAKYALDRCIENIYKEKPYGLYKFGFIEDLDKIDAKQLYDYYKNLINSCKIDIFISGNVNENIKQEIMQNENIKKLQKREPQYNISKIVGKELQEKEEIVEEKMDVNQGKLVVGLDLKLNEEKQKYHALIYNCILGGTANSKMFQNVREKAHLAYVASSSYLSRKSNILINCGIEIANYQKALDLIRKQIDDMKAGNFTDEEIENAKKTIIATIKTIDDEQDSQIMYWYGQELSNMKATIDEYKENIEKIERQDITNIANNVKINTIYFLTGGENN